MSTHVEPLNKVLANQILQYAKYYPLCHQYLEAEKKIASLHNKNSYQSKGILVTIESNLQKY
jgi:hypothetical protein